MRFKRVTIPAADPTGLGEWYRARFTPDHEDADDAASVRLGETTLQFTDADSAPPAHLAFRLLLDGAKAVDWLTGRATLLPVDGDPSRRFAFLDATAVYFQDADGNVLEGLCYDGDPRPAASATVVDGLTEIGLPARDPLAFIEWLETTVGLSGWGTPSDTFAWVGDRHARFVVIPTGRTWYPTGRTAGIAPITVTVADAAARPGRHVHPTLPYEIVVD